jgi:CO dehydrogenase/acetyl-CoA synthase delta subunit
MSALTWDELANLYDKANTGRRARTLPMDTVFEWAEKQVDKFRVDEVDGTIHLIAKPTSKGVKGSTIGEHHEQEGL